MNKTKPPRFTFKRQPRATGLAGVGNPWPSTDIKLRGKVVGVIAAPNWRSDSQLWTIRLMIESSLPPGWYWKTIRQKFPTEEEAREYVSSHNDDLAALPLRAEED